MILTSCMTFNTFLRHVYMLASSSECNLATCKSRSVQLIYIYMHVDICTLHILLRPIIIVRVGRLYCGILTHGCE